jgi:ABC-type glycerol-3-phosphate transport system substrate-binding protein
MKYTRTATLLFFLIILLGLILSACLDSPPVSGTLDSTSELKTIHPATITAISELAALTQTPVPDPLGLDWSVLEGQELEFWYIWDLDEPGTGMNAIVERFNQENEWGITVVPRDRGLVLDPLAVVESEFEEGLRPQIMVGDSSLIAGWYQSDLIVDLTGFMNDPVAGMSEKEQQAFYSGVFSEFGANGSVRPGMPFSQAIQVLYYNESLADELGFDSYPLTAEDFKEQSCSLVESGESAGLIFSPGAANILSFLYAYRGDPGISKEGIYEFSSKEILQFADDLRELSQKGCVQLISNYPNPMAIEREYEGFNEREALMIMGSSLMQEHIQVISEQIGHLDEWKMIAFPGPDGTKVVASEVQSVVIFNSTPEAEFASWMFLKYLTSPEVQAEWSQYSGYYPTRKDSLRFLGDFREANPDWAGGLLLLKYSRSAPLHPSWQTVKLAVEDAFEAILANPEVSPEDQLDELDRLAAELLEWSQE